MAESPSSLIRFIKSKLFLLLERYSRIHITPVHYYSPIPNVSALNSETFKKIYGDTGIDWNLEGQLNRLQSVFPNYKNEYEPLQNTGLTLIDSFILYAMIREKKPRVMVEVGSGETTKISLLALARNREEGNNCQFYAIEPYPGEKLRGIDEIDFQLIDKKLEDIDVGFLSTADLFFIDSSHVSKVGSDVNYEILEIVPNLKKGSIIHWHDIMFPGEYFEDWVREGRMFWNESYLVNAFMLFNNTFQIIWASRYMQLNHSELMTDTFPYFKPDRHRCTSFWIEKIK
ncbi:MAG: class I SAM-dependent methyltransferase [Syntrophales bacterium]